MSIEAGPDGAAASAFRLETTIDNGHVAAWTFTKDGNGSQTSGAASIAVCLETIFECQIPLAFLGAAQGALLRIRFSLWRDQLPLDALPQEGSIEVRVAGEEELNALPYAKP